MTLDSLVSHRELLAIGLFFGVVVALLLVIILLFITQKQARVCCVCKYTMRGGYLPATHGYCDRCLEKAMNS